MPETAQAIVFVAALSFVVATLLTPAVARVAVGRGWLDHPDGRRKLHALPVPTIGGVAVGMGFVVALATIPFIEAGVAGGPPYAGRYLPLILASLAVAVVGLLDDIRSVRPVVKLGVQAGAAMALFFSGFRIQTVTNPFGDSIELGGLALPITVLWLVGMSNALNLIDGMDGLAAGLALVSTLGLLAAAVVNGRTETAMAAAALAGALLGFLPYNFNPARIFLGDCGALPVGFVLAALAIQSSIKASAAIAVAVPLLALALPILDVALAVVRRFVRRRPVFQGDHDHIHHRLVDMGLTPRRAVITLYGVAALFTALALAIAMGPANVIWAAVAVVLLVVGAGVRALGYWEVTEFQKSFVSRLTAGLRPSGDAALRGLELDLTREGSFEAGWERLCETAWQLGLTELHLTPTPDFIPACPERHSTAPPVTKPAAYGNPPPLAVAIWSFEIEVAGRIVAEAVARRPIDRPDFDPRRLVAIVEGLVGRHLASGHRNAAKVA